MVLDVQVISLLVSFLYGIFFCLTLELNYKFIYSSNLFVRIIYSLVFVIFHTLLYFLILMRINNGYVHVYFLFCIMLGYLMCKVVYKRFVKRKQLCYTLQQCRQVIIVSKKHGKYTAKNTGRMIIIFLFFICMISTLSYTLFNNLYKIGDMKKDLKELEREKIFLSEKEAELEADIKRLSDPEYIARYAREKYFYSKEGEIILRMDE